MSEIYQPKQLRYRRNLPHWQAQDGVYATVFRLKGSLPKEVVERLQEERAEMEQFLYKEGLSEEETKLKLQKMRRFYFGKFGDESITS